MLKDMLSKNIFSFRILDISMPLKCAQKMVNVTPYPKTMLNIKIALWNMQLYSIFVVFILPYINGASKQGIYFVVKSLMFFLKFF